MEKRFLIARWLESYPQSTPIYDEASVSSARQRVREAGAAVDASKELVESLALIASELTHNQLAHAKQGYFSVQPVERKGVRGIEVLAADLGPGLSTPILTGMGLARSGASLGAGLEGVFRLADEVEVDSRRYEGMRVVVRKFEAATFPAWEIAIAGKPFPGEVISGDDAVYFQTESGFLAAVCDGLGHGPEAREASNKAMESIARHRDRDLREIVTAVHADISATRGCALSIARFKQDARILQCVSAGDIRAHLYFLRDAHFFTPTPLIVGDGNIAARKLRIEEVAVEPGSVFAMFTDGLESKATLKGELDLLRRPAIVAAQHLTSTFSRGTDDALVFVARFRK